MPRLFGERPRHETLPRYPGGVNFTEEDDGLGMEKPGNKDNPHKLANVSFSLGDTCLVNYKHLLNLGCTLRLGSLR